MMYANSLTSQQSTGLQTATPTSEVAQELNSLDAAIGRLANLRTELSGRISPVSRGVAPRADAKAVGPAAVLGSAVARSIAAAREQVNAVSMGIEDELSALAI